MDVFAVPYESLMDGDRQQGYVFVTEDDKTVRKVPVKIAGFREGVVLIHSGLREGMKLIVSGSAYLDDSVRIQINR
jgi:VCBS repeat-containing protein